MAVKTVDLTRNIRDKIFNDIKELSKEEQIKYYRLRASQLNKKLKKNRETSE